jgi:hypothetical protein
MRIENPLSVFKIKMIIGMSLEPKHKNLKIKGLVEKKLISGATRLY